jgi:hypothetical protein
VKSADTASWSHARTESEIAAAFAAAVQLRAGGLVVGADAFLTGQSDQIAEMFDRPELYWL